MHARGTGRICSAFGNADIRDNWQVHFKDTCIGGGMINNQKLVEILVKNATERFKELESYGSLFLTGMRIKTTSRDNWAATPILEPASVGPNWRRNDEGIQV